MIEKFEFEYQGTRDQCDACGNIIDKFEVTARGREGEGEITICARCLAEPDKINEKLEQHAADAEEWGRNKARWLRQFIGQIRNLPTHAQWQAESDFVNAAYGTYLEREQWDAWTPEQRKAWADNDPVLHAAVEASRPKPTEQELQEFHRMVLAQSDQEIPF
jgi:hypothetical protein